MKASSVTVPNIEQRRGGRPSVSRSNEPATGVHVVLDTADFDRAYAIASRDRITMPEVLRRALQKYLAANGH